VQLFEEFRKRLHEEFGFSDQDALRGAAALTAAASPACRTRQQAWEAANEIAAQLRTTAAVTATDQVT
jgi:hypothetical protein